MDPHVIATVLNDGRNIYPKDYRFKKTWTSPFKGYLQLEGCEPDPDPEPWRGLDHPGAAPAVAVVAGGVTGTHDHALKMANVT